MIFLRRKKHRTRLIHNLAITPPAPHPNRCELAIVTRTKNDELYFQEWVNFHIKAGVQHFFVYLDGDFGITKPRYEALVPKGVCTFIPWKLGISEAKTARKIHPQSTAFAHAILNFGPKYKRFAFIDVDEFLVPKGHENVIDALAATNGHPNVSLPWHMFGFNGHDSRPSGGVIQSYTQRAQSLCPPDSVYTNFKCIVDPCEVTRIGVHSFDTKIHGNKTSNDMGNVVQNKQRKTPTFLSSSNLQLNHYYTRSKSEFTAKISRGSNTGVNGTNHNARTQEIATAIEQDVCEDTHAGEFYGE